MSMADDATLHFPHSSTHPDVLYVPRHVMMHSVPHLGLAALALGVTAAIVFARKRTSPQGVVIGIVAAALLVGGGASIVLRGSFVGALPDKTHILAYTDTGDDPHQYFSTEAEALAQAKSDGDHQKLSPSTARAVAVRWADIPAADRAALTDDQSSTWRDSPATGWSDKDSDFVQTYIEKAYGVAPTAADVNSAQSYHQAVEAPGMTLGEAPADISHSTEMNIPGNPLHLTHDWDHYQCIVHLADYRANELQQPVSARVVSLECAADYDVMQSKSIQPDTPHVMVKKLGS